MELENKTELPHGFNSWISFFDYLDGLKAFDTGTDEEPTTFMLSPEYKYTIRVSELKAHCFDEIHKLRVNSSSSIAAIQCIQLYNEVNNEDPIDTAAEGLLYLLQVPSPPDIE